MARTKTRRLLAFAMLPAISFLKHHLNLNWFIINDIISIFLEFTRSEIKRQTSWISFLIILCNLLLRFVIIHKNFPCFIIIYNWMQIIFISKWNAEPREREREIRTFSDLYFWISISLSGGSVGGHLLHFEFDERFAGGLKGNFIWRSPCQDGGYKYRFASGPGFIGSI